MAIYVLIPTVAGDVTVPGYEKCFAAHGFSFGVERDAGKAVKKAAPKTETHWAWPFTTTGLHSMRRHGGGRSLKPGTPMTWDNVMNRPWDNHGIVFRGTS